MSPLRVRLNLRSTKTRCECLLLSFTLDDMATKGFKLGETLSIGEAPERSCELENVSTLTKYWAVNGWNVNSRLTIPLKHHMAIAQAPDWPRGSIYLMLHYLHCVTQRRLVWGGWGFQTSPPQVGSITLFTCQRAKVRSGNRMKILNTTSNRIPISYIIMRARPGLKRCRVQDKTARSC